MSRALEGRPSLQRACGVDVSPPMLTPNGFFANLEVVASATPRLHAEFLNAIGRSADDPEDRLVDVETQLGWMRAAGLAQVECMWRWRGMALLTGRGAPAGATPAVSAPGETMSDGSAPAGATTLR